MQGERGQCDSCRDRAVASLSIRCSQGIYEKWLCERHLDAALVGARVVLEALPSERDARTRA